MGFASAAEYEAAAQRVVADPESDSLVRRDFSTVYYNWRTNEYAIVHLDGHLSTYYCPDTGQQYWLKELEANQ